MSIVAYRGDTIIIDCWVTNNAGLPFDLGGSPLPYTGVEFTVREEEDDTIMLTKDITNGCAITDPTGGGITITIDAGDTDLLDGQYIYDIEITNGVDVYTVSKGMFEIIKDVSHA